MATPSSWPNSKQRAQSSDKPAWTHWNISENSTLSHSSVHTINTWHVINLMETFWEHENAEIHHFGLTEWVRSRMVIRAVVKATLANRCEKSLTPEPLHPGAVAFIVFGHFLHLEEWFADCPTDRIAQFCEFFSLLVLFWAHLTNARHGVTEWMKNAIQSNWSVQMTITHLSYNHNLWAHHGK